MFLKIKIIFFCFCIINIFCVGSNNPPIIENIIAIPDSTASGGSVLIICNASDEEDKNSLNYLWESTLGEINRVNDKDSIIWVAPNEIGYFSISCEVSDNNNGSSIETIAIKVFWCFLES